MGRSSNEMFESIVWALGGRVAEELAMDDISTGASSDISQATKIARDMVTRYGMSAKLGAILYGNEHSSDEVFLGRDFSSSRNYSEKTAAGIDDEIRSIVNDAHNQCREILTAHMDKLNFVAGFLLKNETMDADQFKAAMENDALTYEDLEQMAEEKKRKSREDNERRHRENEARDRAEAAQRRDDASDIADERGGENGSSNSDTGDSGTDQNNWH